MAISDVLAKTLSPEVKLVLVTDNANALNAHFRIPQNKPGRLKDGDFIRGVKFGQGVKTFKYFDDASGKGFVDEFDIIVPEKEIGSLKIESRNGLPDDTKAVQELTETLHTVHKSKPHAQRESIVKQKVLEKSQNPMSQTVRSLQKSNNAVQKSRLATIPEETILPDTVPLVTTDTTVKFSPESKQAISSPETVTVTNAPEVRQSLTKDAFELNQTLQGAPQQTLAVIEVKTKTSAPGTSTRFQKMSAYIEQKRTAAFSAGKISKAVSELLSTRTFATLAAATLVGVVVGSAVKFSEQSDAINSSILQNQLGQAAEQYQRDTNGCYLYDRRPNASVAKRKISLLTCGQFDIASSLETCTTQTYTTGTTLSDCAENTFNPCAKGSTNRAASGPLVPDACSTYVYKTTVPPVVPGVTVKDACKTEDGKVLNENQACSLYCKTSNFNLPAMMDLVCIQVDYPTAYADLLNQLDIPPEDVFVPPPSLASTSVSKPLLIAAMALGGLFILLGGIYWTRRRRKLIST